MHSVSQEAGSSWLKLAQAGSRLIHWAEIQEGAAFFDAFLEKTPLSHKGGSPLKFRV